MLDEASKPDSEPATGEIPLVFAAENKPQTRRSIFSRSAIYPHTVRAISAEAASELQAHRRNRSNPLDATLRLLEDFTDHSTDQLYTDSNLVEGPTTAVGKVMFKFLVLLICVTVGFSAVAAIRQLQRDTRLHVRQELASQASRQDDQVKKLKKSVDGLLSQRDQLQKKLDAATSNASPYQKSLDMLALNPVEGSGVEITIDAGDTGGDHQARIATLQSAVHDTDLQQIVNMLWAHHAEAIDVNDVRIGAQSSIRVAGTSILVGTTIVTAPYTIRAIGDASALSQAITPQFFPQRSQLESQGVKVDILTRKNMHMAASSSPLSSSSSEEKAEQESIEKYSAPGASAR